MALETTETIVSLSLHYDLHDAGWATATVRDGDRLASFRVSYLNDSLRELATAALSLWAGAHDARIVFMEEPGEHHLCLRVAGEALAWELRWFDDYASWNLTPLDKYRVVLSGNSTLDRFVGEAHSLLEGVLAKHGVVGYRENWEEHPFPEKDLEQLRRMRSAG
jgi:hypothetical protein